VKKLEKEKEDKLQVSFFSNKKLEDERIDFGGTEVP